MRASTATRPRGTGARPRRPTQSSTEIRSSCGWRAPVLEQPDEVGDVLRPRLRRAAAAGRSSSSAPSPPIIVSDHSPSCWRSSTGKPSISAMTISGSGLAMSSTKSHSPRAATSSTRSRASSRTWSINCVDARRREAAADEPALTRVLGIVHRHDRQIVGAAALRAACPARCRTAPAAARRTRRPRTWRSPTGCCVRPSARDRSRASSRNTSCATPRTYSVGSSASSSKSARGAVMVILGPPRNRRDTREHERPCAPARASAARRPSGWGRCSTITPMTALRSARTTAGSCSAGASGQQRRGSTSASAARTTRRRRAAAGARRRRRGSPRRCSARHRSSSSRHADEEVVEQRAEPILDACRRGLPGTGTRAGRRTRRCAIAAWQQVALRREVVVQRRDVEPAGGGDRPHARAARAARAPSGRASRRGCGCAGRAPAA